MAVSKNDNPHDGQPDIARLSHRAVKIAELAVTYDLPTKNGAASEIAALIADIPDRDIDGIDMAAPIAGCPAGIIPLFAGYSRKCADCPCFACRK